MAFCQIRQQVDFLSTPLVIIGAPVSIVECLGTKSATNLSSSTKLASVNNKLVIKETGKKQKTLILYSTFDEHRTSITSKVPRSVLQTACR